MTKEEKIESRVVDHCGYATCSNKQQGNVGVSFMLNEKRALVFPLSIPAAKQMIEDLKDSIRKVEDSAS